MQCWKFLKINPQTPNKNESKVVGAGRDRLDVGDGAKKNCILWQKRTQKHNFVFVLPYNTKMNKGLIFTNKFYNLDY
jgi:hypothetical protein